MRILLVVHGFPPTAMGGTEIYTHDLARSLCDSFGDDVVVLACEADRSRPEYAVRTLDQDGVAVHLVNNTYRACRSFADTYRNPTIRAVGAEIIDQVQPDVAHIQHLTCLSTELVVELAQRRIPTFFTLNDYWLICHRGQLLDMELERCPGPERGCGRCIRAEAGVGRSGFQAARLLRSAERVLPPAAGKALRRTALATAQRLGSPSAAATEGQRRARHMRWIASRCTRLLAPSRTLLEHFLDFGVAPQQIAHVHQGIDQRPFADFERSRGDRLRIGFLGSMICSKAPHLLLEAFAGLPPGAATLKIYGGHGDYHGDTSYRDRIEPLLDQPGVNHHGSVPHDQVARVLAAIDVLVIPSIWLENAPFVIREAFVAGVPVVTSDLGGMAEMVEHEVSGLRFSPGDADALRRTLARLIDEPDLLERLCTGIPRMMTIDEDAAKLRGLYSEHLRAPAATTHRRIASVVLNFRTPNDTVLAVRSLRSSRRPLDHVVVVDNGSGDDSEEILAHSVDGVELVQTGANLGFSGGCNTGIRRALSGGADAVLLVNGDVMLANDTVARLERALDSDPDAGIAGALLLHRSDPSRIASAGMRFNSITGRMLHLTVNAPYDAVAPPPTRRVDAVSGCAVLIRRWVLDTVGLLDEDYFFTFEDLDLCLRARTAGWHTVCVGDAIAYHAGSLSIGPRSPARLYYATRNHLLAARRAAPLPLLMGLPRAKFIVLLNLAHALRSGWVPPAQGVAACLRGAWDHVRKRYGPAPDGYGRK